ncbi:DUF742 domain-containing protein [Streptomyces gardneri]|uniref:DUF742 domain-containing protein n=1 Tax=Streptomyces gardneri TaxID=66892 RepID=UPI0036C40D68
MRRQRAARRLVPAYLATGGRTTPSRNTLDRLTLLSVAVDAIPEPATPPRRRVVELLLHGPLSLAEVAAHVGLPLSVVRVLVCDLVDAGLIRARAPIPPAENQDRQLLERVLSGLRELRGS